MTYLVFLLTYDAQMNIISSAVIIAKKNMPLSAFHGTLFTVCATVEQICIYFFSCVVWPAGRRSLISQSYAGQ